MTVYETLDEFNDAAASVTSTAIVNAGIVQKVSGTLIFYLVVKS